MKTFLLTLALLFASLAAAFAAEGTAPASIPAPVYACPMHPWIKSDHEGKCTICGMDLVLAAASSPSSTLPFSPSSVSLAPSSISAIGVETSVVSRQPLTRTLRVAGRIEDDDTRHRILSARVPGRIEQLHINYVGAEVAADAPLVTLYSPDVLTAQRVFVERLKAGAATAATDLAAAREKLLELGLTNDDVAALEKSLKPDATVIVRAPFAGTVVSKAVYEGQYVAASDRLLELADFSHMWFIFDAYEQDIPWLRVGQQVEITTRAVPGEIIHAPIQFIDPNFDETTRTAKVRAVLPNPHYGHAGESHRLPHRVVAEGRVLVDSPAVLVAPRSAILDTGDGPLAYVDLGDGHYSQRHLRLGRHGDALVEVLDGLSENEKVVTTGALLVDAQAQLSREAGATPGTALPPTAASLSSSGLPVSSSPPLPVSAAAASTPDARLAAAAIDAADALGSDDYARYQKIFPTVVAAAKVFPALPALEAGNDLASARHSFEPWSTAVADLLKPHRAQLGVKVFQCPMSPIVGKGRWLQRSQPLKNPFFGASMPDCGEEVP